MAELDSLSDAIRFATSAHEGQVDKAGQPYILHPLRVMLGCSERREQIAALLHDTVDDCPGVSLQTIERRFGKEIAEAVDALTKRTGESYADFIARCARNSIARAVKAADLRDNLDLARLGRAPTPDELARHRKYEEAVAMLLSESP